jgi:hypothetical protein
MTKKKKASARPARAPTIKALQAKINARQDPTWIGTSASDVKGRAQPQAPTAQTIRHRAVPHPFDLGVQRDGGLYLMHPHTRAVREWIEENVCIPDAVRLGNAVVVEGRYIGPIVEGIRGAGFTVGDEP